MYSPHLIKKMDSKPLSLATASILEQPPRDFLFDTIKMESRVSTNTKPVSDDEFESTVLQADKPVLVDYWAEWCGPCKMIAPILDEIADEYGDQIAVVKMNIDENSNTPQHYGVRGIPTLMLFKDGDVEATKVGALTKGQLKEFLDANL